MVELVDELVHADLTPFGELAQALVLLVGQADGQPPHSYLPKPRANRRAERTSFIRDAGRAVITAPSLSLATVWTWSRLMAQVRDIPSSGVRSTSEGMSRMVVVTGAMVTSPR